MKARTIRAIESSRTVEYAWVLSHLKDYRNKKILDVGSTGSIFPIQLANINSEIFSIDVRNYLEWNGVIHPNMAFIKGDITQAPFSSGIFDLIIAISTIEHIATQDYLKIPIDKTRELKAIQEISRLLKRNGKFIFTLPYKKGTYDKIMIKEKLLNKLFDLELEEYFCFAKGFWNRINPEDMNTKGECLICIVANPL